MSIKVIKRAMSRSQCETSIKTKIITIFMDS